MSRELECAHEDLDLLEAQLELAWRLVQQYRAEVGDREDLMAEGFCQGIWFEENYQSLKHSIEDRCLPKAPTLSISAR